MHVVLGVCPFSLWRHHDLQSVIRMGATSVREKMKHRVSGPEMKTGRAKKQKKKSNKGNKGGPSGKWRIHHKGYRGELATRCGRESWQICVVHIHNDVTWGKTCDKLRSMYLTRLAQQVDIVVVMDIGHGTFDQNSTIKR